MRRPYVIAHRGISGRYPENTLLSFQKAIEAKTDWIELDVHMTADGNVIVSHDWTADRCTDGHGAFNTMTLQQVKQLDAGIRRGAEFAGTRIPTLEETLDFMGDGRIRMCIEIKGKETGDNLRVAWETVKLLQKYNCLQYVVLSSYNPETLCTLKTWEPLIATSLDPTPQDGSFTPWELCQQVLKYNINAMMHDYSKITPELIDEAHQHGFSLWTWTVNKPDEMRQIIAMEPDAIMTDHADVLLKIVDEMVPARTSTP